MAVSEVEKMSRAKMYLEKLASGTDPISGKSITDDSVLKNERLVHCFEYVAGVLGKNIENAEHFGHLGSADAREKFNFTDEMKKKIEPLEGPVGIKNMTDAINAVIDREKTRPISIFTIGNGLVKDGLLKVITDADGKSHKVPTEKGEKAGITIRELVMSDGRHFKKCVLDQNMQTYIIEHINEYAADEVR